MYEVFDNILTTEEQEEIIDIFFNSYFPFYFANSTGNKSVIDEDYQKLADINTVESNVMIHSFIRNGEVVSNNYQKIEFLLHRFGDRTNIKFSGVYRCKLNLEYQVADYKKHNYRCPHIDQHFDHKVLIYYPFTSDGDTFLFNEIEPKKYEVVDRINPIGGRFLLMDKMFHAGQPPTYSRNRMSLNYNLKGVL